MSLGSFLNLVLGRSSRPLALPAAASAHPAAPSGAPPAQGELGALPERRPPLIADAASQTAPVVRHSVGTQTETFTAAETLAQAQARFMAQIERASEQFGQSVRLTLVRQGEQVLGCLLSSPSHDKRVRLQKQKPLLLIAGSGQRDPDRPKFETPLPTLLVPAPVCAQPDYDPIDLARQIGREEFDCDLGIRHLLLADLPNHLIGTAGPSALYAARFVHDAGRTLHHHRAVNVWVGAPGDVALSEVLQALRSPKTGRLDGRYAALAYVVVSEPSAGLPPVRSDRLAALRPSRASVFSAR